MENWNYAHAASRGTIARRYSYSYEQGLGFEVDNYEWQGLRIPGTVMDITEAKSSEHNLRNLYRRWAEFMEAESWEVLATWRHDSRAAAEERREKSIWRKPEARPTRRRPNTGTARRRAAGPISTSGWTACWCRSSKR